MRIYLLNNQPEKAKALALEQLTTSPFAAEVYYELACADQALGNTTEAIKSLNKVLEIWKDADDNFIPAQKAKAKLAELRS